MRKKEPCDDGCRRLKFIHQLVAMGSGSLLQYVSESSPYSADPARVAVEAVRAIASEERDETAHLTRLLQKCAVRPPKGGSYPSHFTTMNFVTLEYLLPKLIAEHEKEIAQIAAQASQLDDEAGQDCASLSRHETPAPANPSETAPCKSPAGTDDGNEMYNVTNRPTLVLHWFSGQLAGLFHLEKTRNEERGTGNEEVKSGMDHFPILNSSFLVLHFHSDAQQRARPAVSRNPEGGSL